MFSERLQSPAEDPCSPDPDLPRICSRVVRFLEKHHPDVKLADFCGRVMGVHVREPNLVCTKIKSTRFSRVLRFKLWALNSGAQSFLPADCFPNNYFFF